MSIVVGSVIGVNAKFSEKRCLKSGYEEVRMGNEEVRE